MDGSIGTGEIAPVGGEEFYSSARDFPQTGITQTGELLPAEEPLPGDTVSKGGGGGGGTHMLIYRAGQTTPDLVTISDIMDGYDPETHDNWFAEFKVENGRLKDPIGVGDEPVGTSSTEIYDGDANADPIVDQTYFRVPTIITISGKKYTFDISGVYRENVVCTPDGPQAELIRRA